MPGPNAQFLQAALIFGGAGAGGLFRYWLGGLVQSWWGTTFPLGTLVVNVSGCLAVGFLGTLWSGPPPLREEYRAAVLIGLLGGYTTLSTFGWETLVLARAGESLRAGGYVLGTVAISLLAVWIGAAIASRFGGAGTP